MQEGECNYYPYILYMYAHLNFVLSNFWLLLLLFIGSTLVSSSDQSEIVNKHNTLRRGVNPNASNMLQMVTFLP